MKLLFASDLHGSNVCFQKFLVESRDRAVDFAIIGGDVTGKSLVYIHRTGTDTYQTEFLERKREVHTGEELLDLERDIADTGQYSLRIEQHNRRFLSLEGNAQKALALELSKARLRSWLWWAKEEFAKSNTQLIWICGNDDPWEIDCFVSETGVAKNPEEKPFQNGGYTFVGESGTNEGPWKCPRDMDEHTLRRRIEGRISSAGITDFTQAIFVFHAPPKGSQLDDAPALEDDEDDLPRVKTSAAQILTDDAGSQGVRDVIEEFKPMISLHGHIHESPGFAKIGRTLCCNPGSHFGSGVMRAVFLECDGSKVVSKQLISR